MLINSNYNSYLSSLNKNNNLFNNFNNKSSVSSAGWQLGFALGSNKTSTSDAFRSSLLSVRSNANNLLSGLNKMRGIGALNNSVFGFTTPSSGNTGQLEILSSDPNRLRTANLSGFTVETRQLATTQQNRGNALSATGQDFTVGTNQIAITVGDTVHNIEFDVTAGDTNRNIQDKIAQAVNRQNIGVVASVSRDTAAGTSTLSFESAKTGVNNADHPNFTVSAAAGSSGAAALSTLGGDLITQQAQNAEFKVNQPGGSQIWQSSKSNDVNLGLGMMARLKDTGTTEVTIGRDEAGQLGAFRDLVKNLNELMKSADSGSRLERDLNSLVKTYGSSFNRIGIGISFSENGMQLSIKEDRMKGAIAKGDTDRFMGGSNATSFGFANRLERLAGNVNRNTASFMNQSSTNSQNTMSMSNYLKFNNINNTGTLFQSMF